MFGTKNINTSKLSQNSILEQVSEYDLWRYYLGEVQIGKVFKSPLREDNNPSASLFVTSTGKVLIQDFGLGKAINIFSFLKLKYNLDYHQVLVMIDRDFNLGLWGHTNVVYTQVTKPVITNYRPTAEAYAKILIKKKKYTKEELEYWTDYCINQETLDLYKVYSLKCFWINKGDNMYQYCNTEKNFIFCYDLDNEKYKIYQPLNHNYRFMTNAGADILQGINQLKKSGKTLIITKALKDVMVLKELGYNAIAVQSENSFPSPETILALKERFKTCYIFFDNDRAGQESSDKLCKDYDLLKIEIPKEFKSKDISDFIKKFGKEETLKNLKLWLKG